MRQDAAALSDTLTRSGPKGPLAAQAAVEV